MDNVVEIKLTRKLPELEPAAAEAYTAAMLEMYNRGFADAMAKHCDNCGYKSYFDQLATQGDCNDCAKSRSCPHVPRPGSITRINCPLWRGKV